MATEKKLIKLLQGGSVTSFAEIYHRYVDNVYSFLLTILKDNADAQDAVQDVFIKLWENKNNIDGEKELSPYLFKIAKNHALNVLRHRAKSNYTKTVFLMDMQRPNAWTDDIQTPMNRYSALLQEAIARLPEKRKKIFCLSKLDGKSYKEIADALNISQGTVEIQMVKALKQIKKYLEEHEKSIPLSMLFIYCAENIRIMV